MLKSARIHGFLVLLLGLSGCGTSQGGDAIPSSPGAGSVQLTINHSAQQFPLSARGATDVAISGRDAEGNPTFSVTQSKAPKISTPIPPSTVTLTIDYLVNGTRRTSYTTSADFASGPVTLSDPVAVDINDPVVYSLAFFGCNRVQRGDAANHPGTANEAQLVKDYAEIPSLQPAPNLVFMAGDLVMNLESGATTLTSQLQDWKKLYATTSLSTSGIPLVALTGNHESLYTNAQQIEVPNTVVDASNTTVIQAWTQQMAAFIAGQNGPTPATVINGTTNRDGLLYDESRMSYSFTSGRTLFVVLNTDSFIDNVTTGDIPLTWVSDQLARGAANPAVDHIFLIGHKPLVSPDPDNPGIQKAQATALNSLMNLPGSKVRAYLCAHAHLWAQGLPFQNAGDSVIQIIAGNGGSKATKSWSGNHGYYGYTVISITQSGSVVCTSYGRKIPSPYDDSSPQKATKVKEFFTVYHP